MSVKRLKIISITPGSVADRVGLKVGDVLESYNDHCLESNSDLSRAIDQAENQGTIDYVRNLERQKVVVQKGRLGLEVVEFEFSDELSFLDRAKSKGHNSFRELLGNYVGKYIRINIESPTTSRPSLLARVGLDHFAVIKGDSLMCYAYSQIIGCSESLIDGGVLTIVVNHLVVYKGGGGVGLGLGILIPLGDE
jgi:hypothetical protein